MKYYKELIKIFIICFLIGGAINTVFSLLIDHHFNWYEGILDFLYSGILTAAIWIGNGLIAEKLPISWVEQPVKRLIISIILTILYTAGVAALINVGINLAVYGNNPLDIIKNISPVFIITVLIVTFLISLFLHGRSFLLQWKESVLETERLKQAHLSSRFESLKNQVNPHFLFNSLNVLSGLVYKDADLAAKFIKHLADVYRYVLDTRDWEVVPLEKELEVLQAYLFLLHIRFGDNLKVEFHLQDCTQKFIPPLTLQMLVENAIKHNIASRQQPLFIHITQENNIITVKNNLQIKNYEQDSNGIGLTNIQERYRYITDEPVQIIKEEQSFSVSVPVISIN